MSFDADAARNQPSPSTVDSLPRGKRQRLLWLACLAVMLGVSITARYYWGSGAAVVEAQPAQGSSPAPNQAGTSADKTLQVVAEVNGERISRHDLANEALRHYGTDVLESLLNKYLIAEHCRQRGVQVTPAEVEAEIDRMSQRFGLPRDQWLKLLEEERHINPMQYAEDIIWPSVALRKLAANRIEPTEEDIQKAYQTQFGPSVQVRIIVCGSQEKAQQVYAMVVQDPSRFPDLAKEFSEDPSASAKGLIHPVRPNVGDAQLERIAFALQPGQVSEVFPVAHQFVILRCESHIPGRRVPMEEVHQTLKEACRDKNMRLAADEVFGELQKASRVENIYSNPELRSQRPGVAATVNGQQITVQMLAEECIKRHGLEVLEGMVNRRLLEQACRRGNIEVTQQDMQHEIALGAESMGKLRRDGTPDIEGWLAEVAAEHGNSLDIYHSDVVWPSVALKKLVGDRIEVTESDLQKGYESNYGPRVRCRAIVFNHLRRAQEVFEIARQRPTADHFGNLAEQYSIEATSRVLRGEVPPIQRHGGQPELEKEAFSLQPGQISSIVQVGDKFILLFCEGYTTPTGVNYAEVRELIQRDVFEKKQRVAMARYYEQLQQAASIDNYLAGTSQSPRPNPANPSAAGTPGATVGAAPAGVVTPPGVVTPATAVLPVGR